MTDPPQTLASLLRRICLVAGLSLGLLILPSTAPAWALSVSGADPLNGAAIESLQVVVLNPGPDAALADRIAGAVAAHATPVGSGTVARTERIPLERRAEAAVIAWMRHQTTAYDSMAIPRVKGRRREVRRHLAGRSREVLARYRRGDPPAPDCPLARVMPPTGQARTA